jgi:hypothetical protein
MIAMAQANWSVGQPLVRTELALPTPRANEVRVAGRSTGVNPVDWKMRRRGPLRLAARLIGPPPPVVPGVDFAGVVEAVGDRVVDVQVGDAVVGSTNFSRGQRGSYADTVVVGADQLCVLPAGFDLDVAAALPVAGVTAWMCVVEIGRIREGKRVAVLGASGAVGQFSVQIARKLRGAFVAGVCSAKNAALVRERGADVVLDYTAGDALAALAPHGPFDLVVDCVGGYSAPACRALLGPGGRHVMVAGEGPGDFVQILVPPFKSRTVLGVTTRERLQVLVDAVASGRIVVPIAKRLPLAQAEEALALSEAGRMTGKIVLVP